jgi:tRNA(fMet)-specific endonuclease VapC
MYLLDTNICIALMNGNRQVIRLFNQFFPQSYTSTIVIAELYKGIYGSQRQADNLNALHELTQLLDVQPFTSEAALEFGIIQNELKQLSRPTGEMDALIAAVARSNGDIVVTNNIRDFQNIPNLELEDWLV